MKEIRNIIKKYESIDFNKEHIALASVVNVEESSYRRIGARMLVSSSGQWVGGISGGCLEGDALRRSQMAIYSGQPSIVIYDTMEDDANQIGVGLGCNGRIEVLVNPINPTDANNLIEQLKKIVASNKPVVLVTIISSQDEAAKLGKSFIAENKIATHDFCGISKSILQNHIDQAVLKKRSTTVDLINSEEVALKLLFEFIRPEMKLIIIGDNYDVSALVAIAHELGWEIHIVGRQKKIHKTTFEKAKAIYEYEAYDQVPMDEYSSVLLMTHDYNWDKILLKKVLQQEPNYIGMLGPKKRMLKMQQEKELENLSEVSFFNSPVGLDIGAETPEEIAISILAEILAVYRNRNGLPLKLRDGTIHDRL